jgi:hypothetical protein
LQSKPVVIANGRGVLVVVALAASMFGCSGNDPSAPPADDPETGTPPAMTPPLAEDAGEAAPPPEDAAQDSEHDAGPACLKELTVVYSVGTGAAALRGHSNGCWTVLDADGAANASFRKCSTSNQIVKNPGAINYAYDDTNPSRPLSQDQGFLGDCSGGATGDGYEYMAYRGSWRLLSAPHLRAYFAELYGDAVDDVDGFWSQPGVYKGNAQLAGKTNVYPMINVGPPSSSNLEGRIETDALAICKTIKNHGYFGTYVATYADPMPATDPRVLALAKALNKCTL